MLTRRDVGVIGILAQRSSQLISCCADACRRWRAKAAIPAYAQRVSGVAVNRIPDNLAGAVSGGLIYVGTLFYASTATPVAKEPATETAP